MPSTSSRLRYNMILAFVLILVLCSALSFPQYNRFSDDSDLKSIFKKSAKLPKINNLNLVEQVFDDEAAQNQIAVDAAKRKLENSTLGSGYVPQKSWSLHCEPYCPPDDRSSGISTAGNSARQNDDDILLHLNDDKDLYKFLEWTMEQLGSVNSYNASGGSSYYTGLNMWKKGRREMPLYVEEPKYIVVRREPDDFEEKLNIDDSFDDFPFIPPRGRKYVPNLESLFTYNDLFIPHRGKKDKLKDILKYDELFFPHRGRKRTSSSVAVEGDAGGILQGKNKMRTSGGDYYNYRTTSATAKNDRQAFGDWLTSRCDDITAATAAAAAVAPSPHQQLVTNQAGNINALVSAAFHLPQPCQAILADANDAIAADGHQDACTLAACQKENDVKINGFDQSVRAQHHQHSEGGAFNNQQRNQRQRRRLLSSSSSASVEAGASAFLPLTQSDQLNRLQQYPIRNKQWSDYYIRQMAALSRQLPPF